ncbi:MAG: glycosyltransferase [Marinilabiliaceae bacterium]|nr:glycosyltransferase [Marinilabiliaceae bacterium]
MISIIICTYNREQFIKRCLDSLAIQSVGAGLFEIIFVNNNSTDSTEIIFNEFEKEHPDLNITYCIESRQGLSHARNRGISEAKGDVLAFLDDDAIASKDYVKYLSDQFLPSKYSSGGGKILPLWETKKPHWMSKFLLPLVSVIDLGNKTKGFPSGKFPVGANMFFRRKIFEQVGTFNTDLGRIGKNMLGGEEKDLFNRIRNKKNSIGYFPSIEVHHIIPEERTTIDFVKKQALGVGLSEKIRTKDRSLKYIIRLLLELMKWGATLVLSFFYFILMHFSKALMLIKFRYWVTSSFLKSIKK